MEYFSVLFILLLNVICCFAYTDICNVCKCEQLKDMKSETFIAVHCGCNETSSNLLLSDLQGKEVSQINRFTVANCSNVIFESNSFRTVIQLHSLSVISCNTVTFNTGVFSNLTEFFVDDVDDLVLEENAFMGAQGVSTVSVRKTTIREIPLYALYDMRGLRKLEMIEVTLGTVRKQSVNISMDDVRSNFSIINSTIDNIEDEAMIIVAKEIHFTGCNITSVQKYGLQMTADEVYIQNCLLGETLKEDSLNITSYTTNISGNIFEIFYTGMLSHIHPQRHTTEHFTSKISTTINNNNILTLNSDNLSFLSNTSKENRILCITGNRVPCDCKLSELLHIASKHEKYNETVTQNYCIECKSNIYLNEIENRCSANGIFNISLECENFENRGTTKPSHGHRGRGIQFTTEISTEQHHYEGQYIKSNSDTVSTSVSAITTVFLIFIAITI